MSAPADLTHWNRAALDRFRYVDGKAANWLEELRLAQLVRFLDNGPATIPDATDIEWWRKLFRDIPEDPTELDHRLALIKATLRWDRLWVERPVESETEAASLERLITQYLGAEEERAEIVWELCRTFSRALHVLTEHIDAYANEGFLRTASQWENVRRLVAMLDYHPSPPASATAPLILLAKPDAASVVEKGFQVKYSPPDGDPPLVFETLQDLDIDPALNELRHVGWDRNPVAVYPIAEDWTVPEGANLSAGQFVIVAPRDGTDVDPRATATRIGRLSDDGTTFRLEGPVEGDWRRGYTQVLVEPKRVLVARLKGAQVATFEADHGLSEGQVIAWKTLSSGVEVWSFRTVLKADARAVKLDGERPNPATTVYRALTTEQEQAQAVGAWTVPKDYQAAAYRPAGGTVPLTFEGMVVDVKELDRNGEAKGPVRYKRLWLNLNTVEAIYVVPEAPEEVGIVGGVSLAADEFESVGSPGDLTSGNWMVQDGSDTGPFARRIKRIEEREDSFTIELETLATTTEGAPDDAVRFHGPLTKEVLPARSERNEIRLTGNQVDLNWPQGEPLPELLSVGRTVILEPEDDGDAITGSAIKTTIVGVEDDDAVEPPIKRITLADPVDDAAGFTVGGTIVRGNVVTAGHGESKGDKVLGSGDATQTNQGFELAVEQVSWVPDALLDAGVRADITVSVAGRMWEQVSTLRDSRPTDYHYTARMTEDGFIGVAFGDGRRGRRLPTGVNNVRASAHRVGVGLAGNGVGPGALIKPAKPHRLVDEVRQPIVTSGGNDLEDPASLRENGPASVLTLERAVSMEDFAALARRNSSVWQARAFTDPSGAGREEQLIVVVVPAGGGELGDIAENLKKYLMAAAVPGVTVSIEGYVSVPLHLEITVRVDSSAFDPEEVAAAAHAALLDAFSLKRRRLGQALFRSEIYQIVEAVEGVENSDCRIHQDTVNGTGVRTVSIGSAGDIRAVRPRDNQVVYVADDADVEVGSAEFAL